MSHSVLLYSRLSLRRPKLGPTPDSTKHGLLRAAQVAKKQMRETLMSVDGAAAARLSSRLVTLETDVDVPDLRCAPFPARPPPLPGLPPMLRPVRGGLRQCKALPSQPASG